MSERKVLNKYYPPDFDPSKIPRMKLSRNRQYTVRLMAPFNMRCVTCGEYIYKGKKFNARKEDVENEDYLGIRIYRFYIKCTRCLQEISFKTDPKNTDYEIEAGATRNFMALKLAEEQAKREEDELKEEEANNPMKLLENRTEQSRNEIDLLESLEELKDLNRRQAAVDYEGMLQQYVGETAEERLKREEKEDEDVVKSIKFKNNSHRKIIVSEEIVEDDENDTFKQPLLKKIKTEDSRVPEIDNVNAVESSISASSSTITKPIASVPIVAKIEKPSNKNESWNRSVGVISRKNGLAGLVKVNKKSTAQANVTSENIAPTKTSETLVKEPSIIDNDKKISTAVVTQSSGGGLSLLAGYSDSDSNQDSD